MIQSAKNKMLTSRDKYIIESAKKGLKPSQIKATLKDEGFQEITRPRIYQIIQGK